MEEMSDPYSATREQNDAEFVRSEQVRLGALSLEVSKALNEGETLQRMLTSCTESLVRHLDVAFAHIWILDEEEQVLELQASSGLHTHLNGGHARVSVGAFKIDLIAAERTPYLTNRVIDDPRLSDQEWARREGMVAFAGYPLLVGERLIGVMAMFARHPLSPATLQTMATIANGVALGIERLRLLMSAQAARIEAEEAHQRLYTLFMQAPAIICVLRGPQHVFELANPLYLQLVGRRDIIGKPIRKALPELAEQSFYELLDQVYASGEPFFGNEVRAMIDRHNGGKAEEGYFNFVYQPSRNAAGEVDGILVHAVEVTEQVRARESVLRSQKRLEMAQWVGRIGTFEWDIPHNQILWTPELEALYGLPPGGFEGHYENWARRVHPDDLQRAEDSLNEAITGGPPYNVEFRVIWPDATERWLLAKGEIIAYDAQGQPLRMIGVNIDITERKESEEQMAAMNLRLQDLNINLEEMVTQRTDVLNKTNVELQRSNQELQDFAYVASHDLQEPLRKIQAFGNLLEEEYGQALGDGGAYLERMRNAATRMRTLINDLLTFSRVTTKASPFSPVDLAAVTHEVIDDLGPRIQAAQGTVEIGGLPTIEADPAQIYQLLQNLIANALKFQRPGVPPVVKISAIMEEEEHEEPEERETTENPGSQRCVLFVEDNGIGFDEKYLDRIFTVFQRLHGKSEYEGTGIGLAVVRKIVERHDGTVTAKSVIGQGTTFIVTLPVTHPDEKEIVYNAEA